MPNFWDTYYGGGYGVGQQGGFSSFGGTSPSGSGLSGGGYQEPRNAATQNGGTDWSGVLDLARLGYAIYQDRNPRKPQFAEVPLSPEQKQMWDLYLKSMMNPALKNNAAQVNQNAGEILSGYSNLKWQSPALPGQTQGYTSHTPFTPFANQAPPQAQPQATPQGGQISPNGLAFGGGSGVAGDLGRLPMHRMQDSEDRPMGVMEEIGSLSAGMGLDPMNRIHAGNATGDPGYQPTQWPAGTGPNAQQQPKPIKSPGDLTDAGPRPNSPEQAMNNPSFRSFVDFLTSQGVKDAAQIAFALFAGGLPGATFAAMRVMWNRFQSSKGSGGKP